MSSVRLRRVVGLLSLAVGVGAVGWGSPAAEAGLIVSNLGVMEAGQADASANYQGQKFTMGGVSHKLIEVVARVGGLTGSSAGVTATLYGHDAVNDLPDGTVLTTFVLPDLTAAVADQVFTPVISNVTLAANTSYWFVFGQTAVAPAATDLDWTYMTGGAVVGPGATIDARNLDWMPGAAIGDINKAYPDEPFSLAINAVVPEPGSLALAVVGLVGLLAHRRRNS
jgi:MYXO-CTERM domain-containing protein